MKRTILRSTALSAAAVFFAAGAAIAGDHPHPEDKNTEERVLILERADAPRVKVERIEDREHRARWFSESANEDGNLEIVEIIVKDGDAPRVIRNGEEIEIKVLRDGDNVRVLGPHEEEITEYRFGPEDNVIFLKGPHGEHPAPHRLREIEEGENVFFRPLHAAQRDEEGNILLRRIDHHDTDAPAPEPRRVRLGVTMGAVSEALAAQAGIEPGQAFVITDVLDDYPAKKAGLKKFDLVLKINGEKPATPEKLRELVFSAKDGATISLYVMRGGDSKTVDIKLGAADHDRRAQRERERDRDRQRIRVEREHEQHDGRLSEHHKELEKTLHKHLNRMMHEMPEQFRGHWTQEDMDVIREYADRAGKGLHEGMGQFEFRFEGGKWNDLRGQIMDSLKGVELDGEARKAVDKAMKSLDEVMKSVEKEIEIIIEREDDQEFPRIRFFGENEGDGVLVMPRRAPRDARPPRAPEGMKWFSPDSDKAGETGELSSRLDRLEDRMKRLEQLLEKLVENQR